MVLHLACYMNSTLRAAGPPYRWVGIPCCVGEYEPEPTSTSSVDDRLGTDRTLDALETG